MFRHPSYAHDRRLFSRPRLERLERRLAPATFTVLNANDNGAGSLRDALTQSNALAGADTVQFDPAFFSTPRTINLVAASGPLTITDDVIVTGPGSSVLTIDGGNAVRDILITNGPGTNITISGMTITGSNASGIFNLTSKNLSLDDVAIVGNSKATGSGGGVYEFGAGNLTIRNSTIASNYAPNGGGGIAFVQQGSLAGTLQIENCTISGNTTSGNGDRGGGGIYFKGGSSLQGGLTVRNSTIAGNSASFGSGGGINLRAFPGTATIQNCTIANNSAGGTPPIQGTGGGGIAVTNNSTFEFLILQSTIVSGNTSTSTRDDISVLPSGAHITSATNSAIGDPDGFTLNAASSGNLPFGTNLNLQPLANNGGPRQTVALGAGSPAIDAGLNAGPSLTNDGRGAGFTRSFGAPDIGSFEAQTLGIPTAIVLPSELTAMNSAQLTFQVRFDASAGIDVSTLGSGDVTVTGPNGYSQTATFVSVDVGTNGSPRTATYAVPAPQNTFVSADNGYYTVAIAPNAVADTQGHFVPAGANGQVHVFVPSIFNVTNLADSGPGSFRQAILDANALATPDTINFDSNLTGTIQLLSALPFVNNSLAIVGPGANRLTVIGSGSGAVLSLYGTDTSLSGLKITGGTNGGIIGDGINLTLDGLIVAGNSVTGLVSGGGLQLSSPNVTVRNCTISNNTSAYFGGGIAVQGNTNLTLESSTVSGNVDTTDGSSPFNGGGGIFVSGSGSQMILIRNSTIAGNQTPTGSGGGIFVENQPRSFRIENSTITNNTSGGSNTSQLVGGGGLMLWGDRTLAVTLQSTIISGNTSNPSNGHDDIAADGYGNYGNTALITATNCAIGSPSGFVLAAGSSGNLPFGTNLNLGTLANNGGPTQTIALGTGSAAIDAGSNATPPLPFDQRGPGFGRLIGNAVDIGAFEYQGPGPGPHVAAVQVNDGAAQRSRVTSLTVRFDSQVTFAGAVTTAFSLTRTDGSAVAFAANASVVNGVTVVTLDSFTGSATEFGSLADGGYTLTALADHISGAGGGQLDGDGDNLPGGNYSAGRAQGLFRLFGDVNGDATVNGLDLGFFRNAFGTQAGDPNYLSFLDIDGDGVINGFDLGQFRTRFGTMLP